MASFSSQPGRPRPRVLVVARSGLGRQRLRSRLRRAGLDVPEVVDPAAAEESVRRTRWDAVLWCGSRQEGLARELLAGAVAPPPFLLLVEPKDAAGAASALATGFADVARMDADAAEIVARTLAVARREEATRSLATEVAMFRELAEGGRDLLMRHAPDGTIRYASSAAREILGWEPGDLIGRPAARILPPGALEAVDAALVHRVLRRDGLPVWLETTARFVEDAPGRVGEIQTGSRDVTGRVRAEAERAAVMRVTAAVAEGHPFPRIAELASREVVGLEAAEWAAVVRLLGDEAIVLGAAGPRLQPGERLSAAAVREGSVEAPIVVEGGVWGVVLTGRGAGGGDDAPLREPLGRLAPLISLAVANARARERLVSLARTDPLTGLANHGAFYEHLRQDVARCDRSGAPLTLVMIDLDHFKRVNDTHGHLVGDEVLREVARLLRECARRGDVAGRVGGEELGWILPATGADEALAAAERLRESIAATGFGSAGRLTASLGVAVLGPGGVIDMARRADQALYRAKEAGRNQCVVAPEGAAVMGALFD